MTQPNPATPAQAAIPGSNDQGQQTPAATTPASGTLPAGTVAISAEELRNLQRDAGRYQSFQKRAQFTPKPGTPGAAPAFDPNDPAASAISQAQQERDEANTRALRAEVKGGVADILAKPEYAALPESTKAMIRKNPAMLSEASNVEEALLDIEDFVREEVAKLPNSGVPLKTPSQGPQGHETPPSSGVGAPSNAPITDLEDLSRLSGPARSRAAIRNAIKVKNRGSAA
jgi:hypothetical protein